MNARDVNSPESLDRTMKALIREWTPPERPCCMNCGNARVSGHPDWPDVRCSKGHGPVLQLQQFIHEGRVRGWRSALLCEDYDPVDEGE